MALTLMGVRHLISPRWLEKMKVSLSRCSMPCRRL